MGTITFNGTTYTTGSSFTEETTNIVDWECSCWIIFIFISGKQWIWNWRGDWAANPGIAIRIYNDANNVTVWSTVNNVANTSSNGVVQENKEYRLLYASFIRIWQKEMILMFIDFL